MTETPTVSIVMPVHNALPYLDDSIGSVLGQTFGNFEFVIRDDASTDGSADVLRRWAGEDTRIRLFLEKQKLGPVGSSNWVVSRAMSRLIARMDADDIAHPERIRRQVQVLQQHADVGLVGALFETIDARGRRVLPRDRSGLARRSLLPPFAHGSAMFRREILARAGGYREACVLWEDLDLYLRCARLARIVVLPEVLYFFRHVATSARLTGLPGAYERAVDLQLRCLAEAGKGHDYEALLSSGSATGKLMPQAFVAAGGLQLWAGERPRVLGPLLRGAALAADRATAAALVWALWAQLSPASLRAYLRARRRARDVAARRRIRSGELYDWPIPPAGRGGSR